MKTTAFFVVAVTLAVGFCFLVPAVAQPAAAAEPSAILYKVAGKNLKKPSYLFGTIHVICPNDTFPPATLNRYLAQTNQLVLELNFSDPSVIEEIGDAVASPAYKSVKDLFKPGDYAKVDAMFKDYAGVSYESVANIRPILATTLLFRSPKTMGCAPTAYDLVIMEMARVRRLPVLGLETVEEQTAVLEEICLEKEVEWLTKMAEDPNKVIGEFRTMYAKYLTQDAEALYRYMIEMFSSDPGFEAYLPQVRNTKWLPRLERHMSQKPTFIAVGAGHLGGEGGLIKLLRDRGYTVTPIRL